MTMPMAKSIAPNRRVGRSIGAVFVGFIAVAILSLVTDQVLHVLRVYPPWGQPMFEPSLNVLALAYRIIFTILGGYITARLAPYAPMRHALALGLIGLATATAGAVVTITKYDLGPDWYPIALAVTALPCTLLGALPYDVRQRRR